LLLVVLQQRDDDAGIAQSVPFNVASGAVLPSLRMRIFRRRAWNSVVFEVLVTSR